MADFMHEGKRFNLWQQNYQKKKKKCLVLTAEDFQQQKYCIQPTKYEACST